MSKDTKEIVEKIELCNIPTIPTDFNGPGFINSLSGNTLQFSNKYRISELLEGAHFKFDLAEASQIAFYLELPEDLEAGAKLTKVKATHETSVHTKDLNAHDETFLRQQGGYLHRGVIQIREFLSPGTYTIEV